MRRQWKQRRSLLMLDQNQKSLLELAGQRDNRFFGGPVVRSIGTHCQRESRRESARAVRPRSTHEAARHAQCCVPPLPQPPRMAAPQTAAAARPAVEAKDLSLKGAPRARCPTLTPAVMRLNKPALYLTVEPRCEAQEMLGADADIEDMVGLSRAFSLPLQFGYIADESIPAYDLHRRLSLTHHAGVSTQARPLPPTSRSVTSAASRSAQW